jgi:hypothetical protein
MPALTPEFLFDLESNMQVITTNDYSRLNSNVWWPKICKEMPSQSKKERISWLLESAQIRQSGKGGNIDFEDIVSVTFEAENLNASAGLEIGKNQLEDLDGNGVDAAASWSRQVGAYAAYWPQKMVAQGILANPKGYDKKTFFATDHPVNPFLPNGKKYANVFTGGASGYYPGALPIDDSVTLDVAAANLTKAIAYIATVPMANGKDPRFLRVAGIGHPPAMRGRIQQLTKAKFIAQAATGGGAASADFEGTMRDWSFGEPIQMDELSSAFGGTDTDYYIFMEEITSDPLGAWTYVNREPFAVSYYGPMTDAQLVRHRKFQWTTEGRNVTMPGHPYLLFKGRKT